MKTTNDPICTVLYVTSDDKVHVDEPTAVMHADGLKDTTVRTLNEQDNELLVNQIIMREDDETDEGYVSEEGW